MMKIVAYPRSPHAVSVRPSSAERIWTRYDLPLAETLALGSINATGWELLCPYACEVVWNGGSNPEDLQVTIHSENTSAPPFVTSQLGHGLLTFETNYQITIEGMGNLWVRGPINQPKDAGYPLEYIVEQQRSPVVITIHWQVTRPGVVLRWEQGEPFGVLVPSPAHVADQVTVDIVSPEVLLDAHLQQFAALLQVPHIRAVMQEFQAAAPKKPVVAHDFPPVSCICPTYARTALLEEAIYSFLQQDYPGPKELIVLNDYAEQILSFEHPEVRIINLPRRLRSVGEKYKAAVALCSYDLIFVWHDDDIYLPHRLTFCLQHFDPARGFFKADKSWFWNNGQISGPEQNIFHGGSCWSRERFTALNGYPHLNSGYDIGFERLYAEAQPGATTPYRINPEDIYYIYRWAGTGSYHLSSFHNASDALEQVATWVSRQAAQGLIRQGSISLNPHWNHDYTHLVARILAGETVAGSPPEEDVFPPPFYPIAPPNPLDEPTLATLFQCTYPLKISVILPTLNDAVLLERTVEQFMQTLPPDSEVIVVDNGSTDGSSDFLLNDAHDHVRLIRTPEPLGVAGARNKGLEYAQGEIVVFADAHIDVPVRWWQPIAALLKRQEVGVVGPGIGVMGKPEYPLACGQRVAEPNLRVEWLAFQQRQPYPVPTLGGGFMAMRHDTLKAAGAFDAGMPQWGSEDLEICLRYWLLGYEVWVVPEVAILHYFRTKNPYKVELKAVTHNLLRVAFLHFNPARIARVMEAVKNHPDFAHALAMLPDSDVWQQRASLASRRVRDDDWLFERFRDSCSV